MRCIFKGPQPILIGGRGATHREVNVPSLAERVEFALLPARVAFHLVDGGRDTCNRQHVLQLLAGEVADTNRTGLALVILGLHCLPCTAYVKGDEGLTADTATFVYPAGPMNL